MSLNIQANVSTPPSRNVQTLPVVFTDASATTIVPAPVVETAELGVQVDSVAPAARILAERSVQANEPPRPLVNASTQSVQPNPVLIDSATQTDDPSTVPLVEYQKILSRIDGLRGRLHAVELLNLHYAAEIRELYDPLHALESRRKENAVMQTPNPSSFCFGESESRR